MLGLLRLIDTGNALTPQSRALLLDMMARCRTGSNRIAASFRRARGWRTRPHLSGYTGDVGY
jgi:beta-lactamase class A